MDNHKGRFLVLLVEDHEPSCKIEASLLRELGCECDIARSGMEALGKLSENRYGLVMMDLQLPDIDGLEAAKRFRDFEGQNGLAPTPVIGMTGHATKDDALLCAKAGMNGHLPKPFRLKELEETLRNFMPHS